MHQLLESVANIAHFSRIEIEALQERLKFKKYEQGELILSEGQICESFYFLVRGSIIRYAISTKGAEITKAFYLENEWFLDTESFTGRKPTAHYFQANTVCETAELTIDCLHELIEVSRSFMQLGKILELSQQNLHKWSIEVPEARYRNLLTTRPEVLQHFALKQVASWLEMTPETLSRVRRKVRVK